MYFISEYESPLGIISIVACEKSLLGVWFEGQKYFQKGFVSMDYQYYENEIILKTKIWLKEYFNGKNPNIKDIPIEYMVGSTFRHQIWNLLREIPYGEVVTYGMIAKQIAMYRGMKNMSAQAIGGAVGHNPISIMIPCHRVVGKNGELIGYAGGIERKISLLELEKKL